MKLENSLAILIHALRRIRLMLNFNLQRKPFMKWQQTLNYCDEFGDEDSLEYQKLSEKLTEITSKDISQYDLWEWWETEGIENLSFDICLPEPKIIHNISKQELTEIVQRIKSSDFNTQHANEFINAFYLRTIFSGGYFYN
ncbi:MAG: hypothetical protein ACTIMQ_00950, partial [Acinetobacter guillouiae]